jgi:hypothetical protein
VVSETEYKRVPTIDQLAPATAAADTDEHIVSQSGTALKMTRAQILAGVQPQIALQSGVVLGRCSAGTGAPESLCVGNNLILANGTLSATAVPYQVGALPAGTVPATGDLVPLSQGGINTAVPYSQFMSGLPEAANVNGSQLLVTPTGSSVPEKLADFAARALPLTGGTMTGTLTLTADPTTALQAATKEYVDARVIRSGDTLTGPLILAASPTSSLQAATKGYTDTQVATALPLTGGALTGALSLAADPTSSSQAATKHYVDTRVATALPLSGGTLSGPLTLSANPATALQAAPKQYIDAQVATALPLSGGTLTGALTLAGAPSNSLNAATKQYVDSSPGNSTGVINVKSPPYNAQLNGVTDDTAAFIAAYQAAPSGSAIYVPNGVTVLQNPSSWGVPLTKWVKWIVDGTTLSNGTCLADAIPGGTGPASLTLPGVVVGNSQQSAEVSQGSSQPTDFSAFRTAYIVNHAGGPTGGVVSANSRGDTIIYNSPNNYIWGGLDRLLWCGTQTSAAEPAQHVGRYVQTIRQSVGTNSSGAALPQPQMWASCLEYRDTTAQLSSVTNAGITCEMDWFGNGPDDGHNRQIQSLVVGQNNPSGAPMEISTVVGIYLCAGQTGHAYTVLRVNIPFSTSALDTTAATQMSGAAAIRMAAGHIIAFEPTVTYRLGFDSSTNVLRWYQGTLSYVVGKGISVGFQNVCTSSTTLPNYDAGNIVFLAGSGSYTITLPAAATVAAGTGFTFSATGNGVVTISPSGTDAIDNGPITLRQNDRYQIISDGSSSWREVFRTNSVNPRFTGTPVLPSYTVAGLPAASTAGAKAFASNGRKPTEAAGAGTGVELFCDGAHWISVCSGSQVLA